MATITPLTGGEVEQFEAQISTRLDDGVHTVIVTPASGCYACAKIGIEKQYGSAPGEALTVSVPVVDGGFSFDAMAIDAIPQDEDEDEDITVYAEINVDIFVGV